MPDKPWRAKKYKKVEIPPAKPPTYEEQYRVMTEGAYPFNLLQEATGYDPETGTTTRGFISAETFLRRYGEWLDRMIDEGIIRDETDAEGNVVKATDVAAFHFGDVYAILSTAQSRLKPDVLGPPGDLSTVSFRSLIGSGQEGDMGDAWLNAIIPKYWWQAAIAVNVFQSYAEQTTPMGEGETEADYTERFNKAVGQATALGRKYQASTSKITSDVVQQETERKRKQEYIEGLKESFDFTNPTELRQAYELGKKLKEQGYPDLVTDVAFDQWRMVQRQIHTKGKSPEHLLDVNETERQMLNQLGFTSQDVEGFISGRQKYEAVPETPTDEPGKVIEREAAGITINPYKSKFLTGQMVGGITPGLMDARGAWLSALNAPELVSNRPQLEAERNRWRGVLAWKELAEPGGSMAQLAGMAPGMISSIDVELGKPMEQGITRPSVEDDPLKQYLKQFTTNEWMLEYYKKMPGERGLQSSRSVPTLQWR